MAVQAEARGFLLACMNTNYFVLAPQSLARLRNWI